MLKPGFYKNKRGNELCLSAHSDNLCIDGSGLFYLDDGTCKYWSNIEERYLTHYDLKNDLDLNGFFKDEIRLNKLGQVLKLFKEVESSYTRDDFKAMWIRDMIDAVEEKIKEKC